MNVLVTGSAGYLASLVLPRLAADPDILGLFGIDVETPHAPPGQLMHFPASVLDHDLADIFRRHAIDVVLHLAWVFDPRQDREHMRRVDITGTENVVRAAAAAGVGHVVYLSSTTAYGAHADNPPLLDEASPTRGNADFPYAADKAAVERLLDLLSAEHPGLGLTRVRACIVLGRRTDNFIRALLDLPVVIQIDGYDPPMQFIHEDDLGACLALLVRRRLRGAVNVAPPDTIHYSELGTLLGRRSVTMPHRLVRALVAIGWRLRLLSAPPAYLPYIMWPWVADVQRMREELGYVPRHGSRDAVLALLRAGTGR